MTTAVPPQGVVTFLFTDIEGSTRRWEADPDAMRNALHAHDEVLRDAIAAHVGWLFKHTGDGVCAAFSSPRAAIDAAVAAQLALELPVRMGIATGEAELTAGDYFGPVLNRAARVMACGHGGQILVDGITAGLVSGVDLIGLGPRRLRDLANAVELFQVTAPGLRSDFPTVNALDQTPGNLRPLSTSFIGREREVGEVEAMLKAHRLVTLTGVGGVGKTRLALEVAARAANRFPDGVWVIELAALGDPAAVPEAVAAVLGITQQPGLSVSESVATALESRSRLLVFDNCEHVLDAAADMIESILNHSATVQVLATSREGLRVTDEQLWPVPSLDIHSSAAALFVERAHAVVPGTSLTEAAEAVVEICRRLDGIPLGIELAASRLSSMTVTEVRDHLDDRFRLLVGSRRGLERHQTLRHAVQWSYDLLDAGEKAILSRCSVFAGEFEVTGAQAVADSGDKFATLDLLDALVRKSLLVADQSSGRTRFSMLETIRQFAEEQLVQSNEADAARNAHAHFFAGRETEMLALWDSPHQGEAYAWFTLELPNLRAAFRWAADRSDLDTAAAIAVYATFLGYWVEQHEPIAWAEELIAPAKLAEHRRLAQLYVMSARCFALGRLKDAGRYATAGLVAIESGNFEQVPYEADVELGGRAVVTGRPELCIEWCRTMIARGPGTHTYARSFLAITLTIAGAVDEALVASQDLLEADANPALLAYALNAYGFARRNTDPAAAHDAHIRGLVIARESGNRQLESYHAVSLAQIAATHGDTRDALDYSSLAIRNYYDSGNSFLMPQPLAVLAALLDRLGHHEPASTIIGFATTTVSLYINPEINAMKTQLREALGHDAYDSLAHTGATMTNSGIAKYALGEIDRVRAEVSS